MSFDPSKGPRPVRVEVPMDGELFLRLEHARGDVPRAAFMRRALKAYLALGQQATSPQPVVSPAPVSKRPSVRDTWAR